MNDKTNAEEISFDWSATYSPEDNKLRLYWEGAGRFDDETKERIKAAGFRWASKQELYVAPSWSPGKEDLCLELAGTIEDEQKSALERSADRAERFEGYRQKRTDEAVSHADAFDGGPVVFGNQSRERADRDAQTHDRKRIKAVSQWSKAEYWQSRTAGVINHALFKEDPGLRRRRIKKLETEKRKHEKDLQSAIERRDLWESVLTLPDADEVPNLENSTYSGLDPETNGKACRLVYRLTVDGRYGRSDYHDPQTGKTGSLYDFIRDPEISLTARELANCVINRFSRPDHESSHYVRWSDHYKLRLEYENAMLENEGGAASNVDMKPGGFVGKYQILKVNKSKTTGKIVSVKVNGTDYRGNSAEVNLNIESFGDDVYRDPTPEELAEFKAKQKKKPKAPSLINPTLEDAERLQKLWNSKNDRESQEVKQMNGATYSARSKRSDYYRTVTVFEDGTGIIYKPRIAEKKAAGVLPVCKVRISANMMHADEVVHLTDKKAKPLPLDWEAIEAKKAETVEA